MKIPYSPVRNGNRYFQPTPEMRRAGFRPLALGKDDEASRQRAMRLYEHWTAHRTRPPAPELGVKLTKQEACIARRYPAGSIGEAWQKWISSDEWARMAPSTRNKIWWEAWTKRIEPAFAFWMPDHVTMDDISVWRRKIEAVSGIDPAHKALKVWRAFWRVMTGMRYTQLSDPSEKVTNRAPPSRSQSFVHREAMTLAKTAWRHGFRGLACIVLTAWDTGFAPVDCRTLKERHRSWDVATGRTLFDRSQEGRTKSGVPVIGTLSPFADHLIRRYLSDIGVAMTSESYLFRTRTGVLYGESRLGNDFARIREIALPGDKRQLRDMRRSGVLEAFTGGAKAEAISQKFGNTIGHSNALFRTYNPVDLDQVKAADRQRLAGRKIRKAKEPNP